MKRLSNLMLVSNLVSTLFYAVSYPYIYAETVKSIPHSYIGIEQILGCLGTIVFCRLWNKHGDKLFPHYRLILAIEIAADIILFADVLIRHDLSFYFLFNVIIYATITHNICCGRTKMRAIVNPTEKERERYDNNSQIVQAGATLTGAGIAMMAEISLSWLFIFAFIGNVIDNAFDLYIYNKIRRRCCDKP